MSTATNVHKPGSKSAPSMATMVTVLLLASTLTTVALQPASAEAAASPYNTVETPTCEIVRPEAAHRSLRGNAASVERLYRALFLRSPTEAGLSYWTQRIQLRKTDLRSVAGMLADSEEFNNRYGRLSDTDFVELLYCNVLGRHQRASGSQYWQERLAEHAGRSDITLYFSQSDEFVAQSLVVDDELSASSNTASTRNAVAPPATKHKAGDKRLPLGSPPPRLAMVDEVPPRSSPDSTTSPGSEPGTETNTDSDANAGSETGSKDPVIQPPAIEDPVAQDPAPKDVAEDQPTTPKLVWQDEFTTFDTSVWRAEHSTYGDGNNELQCYRPQNVSVADGSLVLTAKKENYTCPNGSVREATSGMVRGAVRFEYGQRIEFRVKINPADENDQRGLWPALWASSWNGGGWPNGGEFDWLEYVGTTPTRANHAIHYADTSGKHRHVSKAIDLNEKFSDNWHTIGFDWTDDLVWYLDGKEVQRLDPATIGAKGSPFGPNARPVTQIKLNFALGGNWPGPLGPTTLDAEGNTNFAIDYVRVYDL